MTQLHFQLNPHTAEYRVNEWGMRTRTQAVDSGTYEEQFYWPLAEEHPANAGRFER